jgi:tetratricopeptide (TPR) repeat protein
VTIYNEKTKRRVVPRWRSSTVAASAKDFQPLSISNAGHPTEANENDAFLLQVEGFEQSPDLGRAAELLATALRLGDTVRAKKPAEFIRLQGSLAPSILSDIAVSVLSGVKTSLVTQQVVEDASAIAYMRRLLRQRPRSANLWVDLARHQAALGETDKAQKSMRIGLALAPNHRWILRSASRLLLHAGEPEAAHKLLANHPRTRQDPWLMSAEIASAQIAKRPPKFVARAREILRPKSFPAAHISELAAAVATVELEAGANRSARRLLKLALQDPTENALAQVEWAERDSRDGFDLEPIVSRTPDAYEASCWVKYNEGQIEDALRAAREWLIDETYATRPVGMVCYLASFLDDYDTVVKTAQEALTRHPTEVLHRNNLIFGVLSKGAIFERTDSTELAEHLEFLRRRISSKGEDALQATANAGLLFYRIGRSEEGRQLYEATIVAAEKLSNHLISAHAAVMNAREAILMGSLWATEALHKAHDLAKRVVSPGLNFYLRKLDSLHKNPHTAAFILTPNAAKQFTPRKPFVDPFKDIRVENTESGPMLWLPRHLLKR